MLQYLNNDSLSYVHTPSLVARSEFYFIECVGHWYFKGDFERSGLNSYLLLYVKNGNGFLDYRGKTYKVAQGQLFIINCIDYQHYGSDEGWEIYWLHFNGSSSTYYVEHILYNFGPVITLSESSNIPNNIQKIYTLLKDNDKRIDIICSSLIVDMLTEIILLCHSNNEKNHIPQVVYQVISKIDNYFSSPINLNKLCMKIGISRFHLSKLFKRYTGYSPYEYLTSVRLNYAKNLLQNTDYLIYEIAEKVGFGCTSHFIKIFRQYESITPLKYREHWRIK